MLEGKITDGQTQYSEKNQLTTQTHRDTFPVSHLIFFSPKQLEDRAHIYKAYLVDNPALRSGSVMMDESTFWFALQ